jgi:hypothetical protein
VDFPIEYAKNGDVHIAYRMLGQGPFELVIVFGYVTHLGVLWEDPDHLTSGWASTLASAR